MASSNLPSRLIKACVVVLCIISFPDGCCLLFCLFGFGLQRYYYYSTAFDTRRWWVEAGCVGWTNDSPLMNCNDIPRWFLIFAGTVGTWMDSGVHGAT